jgi:hypothetical protein
MHVLATAVFAFVVLVASGVQAGCVNDPPHGNLVVKILNQTVVAGRPMIIGWESSDATPSHSSKLVLRTTDKIRVGKANALVVRHAGRGRETPYATISITLIGSHSRSGAVEIIPFAAGEMAIQWTLEEIGNCPGHRVSGAISADVRPGPPQLLDREPVSGKLPETRRSLSGNYILQIYTQAFNVIDVASGDIIASRAGREPIFSPDGRFVIAQMQDDQVLEIWDVLGSTVIFRGSGTAVAFSHDDSFALVASWGQGLTLVRTLQDEVKPVALSTDVSLTNRAENEKPLYLETNTHLSGSDGYFGGDHEIYLDAAHDVIAYRESTTWGPDGDTEYHASEPLVRAISTGTSLRHFDPIAVSAVAKLIPADRDHEERSWLSDGELQIVRQGNDDGPRASETSKSIPRSTNSRKSDTSGDTDRAFTIDGVRIKRDIRAALSELDSAVEIDRIEELEPLRVQDDPRAAKRLELELSHLYPLGAVRFGDRDDLIYGTDPLPDPANGTKDQKVIDLLEPGQFFWSWKDGEKRYWLHQTVEAGRRAAIGSFTLLSSDGEEKRYTSIGPGDGLMPTFRLGDFRSELPSASDVAAVSLGKSFIAIAPKPSTLILVFDLETWKLSCTIPNAQRSMDAKRIWMLGKGKAALQENDDSSFVIYACSDGARVAGGRYVSEELVVLGANGQFDGEPEAADLLKVKAAGLSEQLFLGQYAGLLHTPGLLPRLIDGQAGDMLELNPPPQISLAGEPDDRSVALRVRSQAGLSSLWILNDGRIARKIGLQGNDQIVQVSTADLSGHGTLKAVVFDTQQIASAPLAVSYVAKGAFKQGRLIGRALGIDEYDDPSLTDLTYAGDDATRILKALKKAKDYRELDLETIDSSSTPSEVLAVIRDAVSVTRAEDTLVLSFAGHGVRMTNGKLALITRGTNMARLSESALSWDDVAAALKNAGGRVVVLLDVCHSGLSQPRFVATNDLAAETLVSAGGGSIIIYSASTGRQVSKESPVRGGGYFSLAFSRILQSRKNYDQNANGLVEASELTRGLRAEVSTATNMLQTPSTARNELFGDFPLF